MAEVRARISCGAGDCASIEPSVNLVYSDVWTDPATAGRPADVDFSYDYVRINAEYRTWMRKVHFAVGVILDPDNRVLLTRRAADAHQGGLWEFPGGKVENGETVQQALARKQG